MNRIFAQILFKTPRAAGVLLCLALALALALASCGGGQVPRDLCERALRPQLYEVTSRSCENPLGETDFCGLTQYLDVADGKKYGAPQGRRVLVVWYAATPESHDYGYVVHPLLGACTGHGTCFIARGAQTEAWLSLGDGGIVRYEFVSYTSDRRDRLLFKMRFALKSVEWTKEIGRRLQIVRD